MDRATGGYRVDEGMRDQARATSASYSPACVWLPKNHRSLAVVSRVRFGQRSPVSRAAPAGQACALVPRRVRLLLGHQLSTLHSYLRTGRIVKSSLLSIDRSAAAPLTHAYQPHMQLASFHRTIHPSMEKAKPTQPEAGS